MSAGMPCTVAMYCVIPPTTIITMSRLPSMDGFPSSQWSSAAYEIYHLTPTMSSVNADLRARLAQVNESILELKLRLKVLEDTRKSILRQLDDVVYPVLTLPHDITSSIFLHCLPADTSSAAKKGPNSTRAPLLLLPVCRTWRDIALSTPRLWASFQLNLFDISDRVGESELEKIIAGWFLRAGACALSFGADSPAYMGKFGAEFFVVLLPNCRAYRSSYQPNSFVASWISAHFRFSKL
ncbi:hypothetical protein DFH08DRAFT_777107 [Mycena albidolilacea]|uniref:F-box domain-containing protein n=1 Tax=Mycena albidolilacea TaxID=1033008 RepID=A0AAD7EV44_9AGAR|nr:hypothetical protein DFH08DRAFT_777107 [Mycena albidolilacea]